MNGIRFYRADPAGNITLLIEDYFPESDYPKVAASLLRLDPAAEQAGFIEEISADSVSLHMAGGEFCGNASLSAAALALMKHEKQQGKVSVTVYGLSGPLSAELKSTGPGTYLGSLWMPLPKSSTKVVLPFDGETYMLPLVIFPGIGHLITGKIPDDRKAESAVKKWCRMLGLPALGIIQLDMEAGTLRPLVYVSAVDTLFWEHSCASGTCAAVYRLSEEHGPGTWHFREPGGILGASAGNGTLTLLGSVAFRDTSSFF